MEHGVTEGNLAEGKEDLHTCQNTCEPLVEVVVP